MIGYHELERILFHDLLKLIQGFCIDMKSDNVVHRIEHACVINSDSFDKKATAFLTFVSLRLAPIYS